MKKDFLSFIHKNKLFDSNTPVLLAVSGGVDSVVMAHLFKESGFEFALAHVCFNLRGKDSETDASFVADLAKQLNVPFYVSSFDTKSFAKSNKCSIQMAARTLRYDWFEELMTKNNYAYTALAHNKNDVAETVLINLTRGTGISGLHGILPKRDKYIRPLLFATRESIEDYAQQHHIDFRTDKSNFDTKYVRNKIRLSVLPLLKEINPSVIDAIVHTAHVAATTEAIFHSKIDDFKKEVFIKKDNYYLIKKSKLDAFKPLDTYLFEVLKDYGFNYAQVEDIISVISKSIGAVFYSHTHKLLNDRANLILEPRIEGCLSNLEFSINIDAPLIETPFFTLEISKFTHSIDFDLKTNTSAVAFFDLEAVTFPLTLRKWQKRDKFMPLGMKHSKLLSDYLIDCKVSMFEKEETYVLVSEEQIVWLVNHRIDNKFKVKPSTKNILKIVYTSKKLNM